MVKPPAEMKTDSLISWSTGKDKTSAVMATGFHKLMVIDCEAFYS